MEKTRATNIIRRFLLCAALLVIIICLNPLKTQAQTVTPAAVTTKSNGLPYYIMVNRACDTVTVYTLDDQGYYSVPVKAFICSTGKYPHMTPRGTYTMGKNKYRWRLMKDNSYAQYACGFNGGVMFHSVCYDAADPTTLKSDEYNALGSKASLGCVRLQTSEAKWIYENCAPGTYVTVYEDEETPGALGKPVKYIDSITTAYDNGWDPTDPDSRNPWKSILIAHPEMIKATLTTSTLQPGALAGVKQTTTTTATAATFDAAFYASAYPDVVAIYGSDSASLYRHYVEYGKAEGRLPNANAR